MYIDSNLWWSGKISLFLQQQRCLPRLLDCLSLLTSRSVTVQTMLRCKGAPQFCTAQILGHLLHSPTLAPWPDALVLLRFLDAHFSALLCIWNTCASILLHLQHQVCSASLQFEFKHAKRICICIEWSTRISTLINSLVPEQALLKLKSSSAVLNWNHEPTLIKI